MGANTKIQWCDHTFNPWRGCAHRVLPDGTEHPGCAHCYAEAMSKRNPAVLGEWGEQGVRVCAAPDYWRQPYKWNRQAELDGCRRRVFCASLADVFEDWDALIHDHANAVLFKCACGWKGTDAPHKDHPTEWRHCPPRDSTRAMTMDDMRSDLFDVIYETPNLDWLLLTKRPDLAEQWLRAELARIEYTDGQNPFSNVWLGTSISDQTTADALIPELLKLRDLAPVLFLSAEPLISPINLSHDEAVAYCNACGKVAAATASGDCALCGDPRTRERSYLDCLDWVIAGGESGHHARPMHPDWVRSLRDQCAAAQVQFFFKQWGEWVDLEQSEQCAARRRAGMNPGFCPIDQAGQPVVNAADRTKGDVTVYKFGKHDAGRLLDGREWNEVPAPQTATTPRESQ